jgi:tripartite ATP-independent transporter DctP family solute receptor
MKRKLCDVLTAVGRPDINDRYETGYTNQRSQPANRSGIPFPGGDMAHRSPDSPNSPDSPDPQGLSPHPSAGPNRRGLLALGLVGLAAAAAPAAAAASDGGSQRLRIGDTVDERNPEVLAEGWFLRRLGELTGGRLRGDTYPGAALGSHDRMNEQLRNGTLQIAKTSVANLEVYDRRLGVFALPFAFSSREHLYAAQDGALGRRLAAILERRGLMVLGWFDSGLRNIYSARGPIREPADMRGLKLRVQENAIMIDTFTSLGAQAAPLPTDQIYSALQQGVVDAAENSTTFYVQQHHHEIATHYSYTRHFYSVDPLLASKKWFDQQSRTVQDAVVQAGAETQKRERAMWISSDEKYLAQAEKAGTRVHESDVAAFRREVRGVYDRHRGTFGTLLHHVDWR